MYSEESNFRQILLITVVSINLMVGGVLIGQNFIKIEEATPTIATSFAPHTNVDYRMECVSSKKFKESGASSPSGLDGIWIVEHYKEYECRYNTKGKILYKHPTSNDEYVRYWIDKNTRS